MVQSVARMRSIALYLPQFHPIPENDEWWGRGFTEWTNVVRATPQYRWHRQPHLPAELGFYDLRVPEVRQAQADLASRYGISGFCYYHYWFHGRRVLERPFAEVLADHEPDFPFCLCWANENWTRAWDGGKRELLLSQTYSEEDDLRHIAWLASAFRDPRYIRIDGRPLFLVYRADRLPDPRATAERWRREARRLGIGELFLSRVESSPEERGDPTEIGFDAAVEFQPDHLLMAQGFTRRLGRRLTKSRGYYRHKWIDYDVIVERAMAKPLTPYVRFPGVMPAWDNAARRRTGATIVRGSSPRLFEEWVAATVARNAGRGLAGEFLFVNAWNEWAEGNHLEPCERWGHGYLEAHLRGMSRGHSESGLVPGVHPPA